MVCGTQQQRGRQSHDSTAAQHTSVYLHTQAGSGRQPSDAAQHVAAVTLTVALCSLASPMQVRGSQVEAAALAVAGAVENNRCPMTNITWVIDGKSLQQQFKFKTAVLNDFEAVGYGIPVLDAKDMVVLNDVPMVPQAPKVVMGPGACSRRRSWLCVGQHHFHGLCGGQQMSVCVFAGQGVCEHGCLPERFLRVLLCDTSCVQALGWALHSCSGTLACRLTRCGGVAQQWPQQQRRGAAQRQQQQQHRKALRNRHVCYVLKSHAEVVLCSCLQVVPGEGAHATFAPRGWRQMALTAYVTARMGHCEIEEVACGRGLELIHDFLLSDPTTK